MAASEIPNHKTTLADVSRTRSNNLGFLRFFFATSIIFAHSFGIMGPYHDPFWRISNGQTVEVGLAINYFFVMSGFLVTASWISTPRFWVFLKKRAIRLYPAVAVMSLFVIFAIGPLSVNNVPEYLHHLSPIAYLKALVLLHVPPLPGVFTGMPTPADVANAIHNSPPVNGPMWSIGYQMRCYMVIAFLGMLGLYRHRGLVLGLWFVTIGVYLAASLGHWNPLGHASYPAIGQLSLWPRLLTYYGAGMLAYLYRDKIPYSPWLFVVSLVGLALACRWGLALAQPILGSYAVFYFAYCKEIPLQNFARNGDLSYGLYIYAWPIQEILAQRFRSYLNPYSLFAAAFVITLVLAILSNRFVEKPSVKWFSRRKEQAPAVASVGTVAMSTEAKASRAGSPGS